MAAINQVHAAQVVKQRAERTQRRILRLPAVKEATGLGRTKIYDLMKVGRFPKAHRIAGANVVGWDSLEIEAWVSEQLECH
jgi:prophage regulatory protein